MKPRNVRPSITLESGEKSPIQPAKTAAARPTHPIHLGGARVFRIASEARARR
jgi:hypothetical protein